jgi:peptidyl-prolyl cis-trans isomerase C
LKRNTFRRLAVVVATASLSVCVARDTSFGQDTAAKAPPPQPPAAQTAAPQPAAPQQGGQAPLAPANADAAQAAGAKTTADNVDPNKVVLTVGNEKVTAGEVEALIADLSSPQRQALQSAGKRLLAEELIKVKLLSQEAQKRGLHDSPKVKRQLQLVRDQILASSVAGDVQRQHYDQNRQQYEKVRARHILIRTPGSRAPVRPGQKELTEEQAKAKADDLRKRVAAGEDFAELARKESDDTVSGASGGDLGEFGHGQMVAEFDKAAFALKPGEVSQPVKTQFGYHIIQVQEMLSFNDVQRDVAARTQPQVEQLVTELRKNTKCDVDESYFGPPLPTPGQPGAPGAPGQPGLPGQGAPGAQGAGQPQQQPPAGTPK